MLVSLLLLTASDLPKDYPTVPIRGLSGSVRMPLIGLGTWQYPDAVAESAVATAFSIGYPTRHARLRVSHTARHPTWPGFSARGADIGTSTPPTSIRTKVASAKVSADFAGSNPKLGKLVASVVLR
jgi:hypothetical protein